MSEQHKVDIFESFRKLNSGKLDFWDNLTEEERKQVSPYVFLMWMQNSTNDAQVMYLNEFVNPFMFTSLSNFNDIAFMLLAFSARGKQNRYSWVKRPSNKEKKQKDENVRNVLTSYLEDDSNLDYYIQHLDVEGFMEICDNIGLQDDEKKKIKKEFEKLKKS